MEKEIIDDRSKQDLAKIKQTEFSNPPKAFVYRVSYDQTDFPGLPEGITQDFYFSTKRALTEPEQLKVVASMRRKLTEFFEQMSAERFKQILTLP